jgi:hypothetical protein
MIIKEIKECALNLQNLITTSRDIITQGHFVDITELEKLVTCFFCDIERHHNTLSSTDVCDLKTAVNLLLSDLAQLHKELKSQHNSLHAESKVFPHAAIAAYQN